MKKKERAALHRLLLRMKKKEWEEVHTPQLRIKKKIGIKISTLTLPRNQVLYHHPSVTYITSK